MTFCNDCNDKKFCDKRDNQIKENKKIEAILNELKRHAQNQYGCMLPNKNIQNF